MRLSGSVITAVASSLYNEWRREWRTSQGSYNDKTGFINRVPDHVLKVAMCLSLSKFDLTYIITPEEITEAIEQITSLVYAAQQTTAGSGIDPQAQQIKKVIDYLLAAKNNQMSRQGLLIAGYGNYDMISLDRVIETLLEMKWITREKMLSGGKQVDWMINLAGEPLARYKKFKEGKGKK